MTTRQVPPDPLRRRRLVLVEIAREMRDYVAIQVDGMHELPEYHDMSRLQQSRLQAGALVGLSSLDVTKLLREGVVQEGR